MPLFFSWNCKLERPLKTNPFENLSFHLVVSQNCISINDFNSMFIFSTQSLQLFVIAIVKFFCSIRYGDIFDILVYGTSVSKPWKADFRVLQVKTYVKTCLESKFSEFGKKCLRKSLIPLEIPVLGGHVTQNRPKWAFLKQKW